MYASVGYFMYLLNSVAVSCINSMMNPKRLCKFSFSSLKSIAITLPAPKANEAKTALSPTPPSPTTPMNWPALASAVLLLNLRRLLLHNQKVLLARRELIYQF